MDFNKMHPALRYDEFQVEPHSVVVPRALVEISMSIRQLQSREWRMLSSCVDFISSTSPGFPDPRFLNTLHQYGAYGLAFELYYWLFEKKERPKWFATWIEGYELPLFLQHEGVK